jgi:hypothetical protein
MSPALGTPMDTDEQTVATWRRPAFRVSCSAFCRFVFSSFFHSFIRDPWSITAEFRLITNHRLRRSEFSVFAFRFSDFRSSSFKDHLPVNCSSLSG